MQLISVFLIIIFLFAKLLLGDFMKEKLFIDATLENAFKDKYALTIKKRRNYNISYFNITSDMKLSYREGEYYNIKFDITKLYENNKDIIKELEKILKNLLKKYNSTYKTLIVGLGNENIPSDSIGPEIGKKVIASYHYNDFLTIPKIAIFNPSIVANTGINSFNLIKMVVNHIKPDVIFLIDSCLTSNSDNLCQSIEINDAGIIRGDSISYNKSITKDTFNIPVIALLVPLIINKDNIKYTIPNINDVIKILSDTISKSINNIYFS